MAEGMSWKDRVLSFFGKKAPEVKIDAGEDQTAPLGGDGSDETERLDDGGAGVAPEMEAYTVSLGESVPQVPAPPVETGVVYEKHIVMVHTEERV